MFKIIRKADIVLFAALIIIGVLISVLAFSGGTRGASVVVKVDGKEYGTYSLLEDRTVTIENNGHVNKITIKNGAVQMAESSCKNQLCVKQGQIFSTDKSIVCLPNRVTVEIKGEDGEYDVIAQ